jgi:hypothetical protein
MALRPEEQGPPRLAENKTTCSSLIPSTLQTVDSITDGKPLKAEIGGVDVLPGQHRLAQRPNR